MITINVINDCMMLIFFVNVILKGAGEMVQQVRVLTGADRGGTHF